MSVFRPVRPFAPPAVLPGMRDRNMPDRADGLCVPERSMRTPASSPAVRGCCFSLRRTIRGRKRYAGTGDCRRRARAFSGPAVSRPVLPDVPVPFVRTPDPLRLPPHGFCVTGLSARPDDAFPDELFRPDPLVGRPCPFCGGGFSIPVLRAEIFGRRAGSLSSVASPYGRPVLLPDRRTASARCPGSSAKGR